WGSCAGRGIKHGPDARRDDRCHPYAEHDRQEPHHQRRARPRRSLLVASVETSGSPVRPAPSVRHVSISLSGALLGGHARPKQPARITETRQKWDIPPADAWACTLVLSIPFCN